MDWIITGASRGIGRALACALGARAQANDRLFLLARDARLLDDLASELGPRVQVIPQASDLSRQITARAAGEKLAAAVGPRSVLVHNAGLWPDRLELVDGFERAYATNCLCPLALQEPLLHAGRLSRVLMIGAGLMIKGKFTADQTPVGRDFGTIRTYCSTKLAGAIAMREVARLQPGVDFAVMHPGVVRTELGDRRGVFGALLRLVKRRWESPETCADRLVRMLGKPSWQTVPGETPWFVEEVAQPWPAVAERYRDEVRMALERDRS